MAELVGFPMLSQRDGSNNADFDCVPTSIASCLEWLTGQKFSGSEIKNAVYGAAYVGGTAASAYVAYCASHGVKLVPVDGNGTQLVQALHSAIEHQTPALITEPSPYGAGWSHVCAAYKCDGGSITVMDPWIDAPVTKSDATWVSQLEFNQIWTLELENSMIDITNPWVAGYFKQIATGPDRWQCAKTGQSLFAGILMGWRQMNGAPRLPTGPEVKCGTQAVYQHCESGIMLYDPLKELDAPSGPWAPCYLLKLDSDLAKKLLGITPPAPQPALNLADAVATLKALDTDVAAKVAQALKDLGVQ